MRRSLALDADLDGLRGQALELRPLLLDWWHANGRHTIPWKRNAAGARLGPGEPLDPYPIWVAEVMRAVRQHSWAGKGPIACALPAFGRS